jgi:hypothetical protein
MNRPVAPRTIALWPLLATLLFVIAALSYGAPRPVRWRNSLQPAGPAAAALTLARAGATEYVIVIPAAATTQDRKAAEDLALWLGQTTGAGFEIVPDTQAPRATEISIGETNRVAGARVPVPPGALGNEGYAIGVSGQRLLLLGGKQRGAINAVYALLEEDLGCRWYDRTSARIPRHRTLTFRPVPRSYVPGLMLRDPFYYDAFDGTWSLRNRTNAPSAAVPEEWGGHVDYDGLFVHTFNTLVPPGEHFEKHPEYFMQGQDGKRHPQQLCLTNPDVIRLATASLLAILRENPHTEIVEVSPNDGGGHCLCPNCQAVDEANGSPSGTLITFVNRIAEAVAKERPEVMVSTLAYLDTVDPPKLVRPRPNVIVRLCDDLHSWRYPFTCFATDTKPESKRYREAIIGWSKVCDNLSIWDYFVNFSHYSAPMPNMDLLQPTVDFYVSHKVTGIMMQAAYQGFGGEFAPLRSWVMAKLLWNPSLRVPDLVNDFICGYYGRAAGDIREYWDLLYATKARHMDTMAAPQDGIRYPMTSPFLSKAFLDEATRIFEGAEQHCPAGEVRRRVELAKLPILYVKLMQGPDAWAEQYAAVLAEFEAVARREQVQYLREGGPDLEEKLQGWRDAVRVKQSMSQIREGEVTIRPLSPEWRFATDPRDAGLKEGWFDEGLDDSRWAVVRSDRGNGWESQGFPDYTGLGWYRQQLTLPAEPARQHAYLYFGAVDEDAWVYLNGRQVGEHSCPSTGLTPEQIWTTPFLFDAAPHLRPGQSNTVAVRVLNRQAMGGIYLPVTLVLTDRELDAPLIQALLAKR